MPAARAGFITNSYSIAVSIEAGSPPLASSGQVATARPLPDGRWGDSQPLSEFLCG